MSKARSASKISLTSFDQLFQPTDGREADSSGNQNQVTELPIEKLISFHNHPFKVLDDDKMQELVSSIQDSGILSPIVVRKTAIDQYEIISGHRRTHAAGLCGMTMIPAIVRTMSDDEAAIAMVNANQQREFILPSEKAKAYQIKYEAMKHQGQTGGRSLKKLEEESDDSQITIHRYLRLNHLSEELLEMVDAGKIGFIPAVDLSFLTPEQQQGVYETLKENRIRITKMQAAKLKEASQKDELSLVMIAWILSGSSKNKDSGQITLKKEKVRSFFDADVSDEDIEKKIYELLKQWKESGDAK